MTESRYYQKPGPMAPLALVDEWLGIWNLSQWLCYKVKHYEELPKSRQFIQDFGAVAAAAWTGATSTLAVLQQRLTPPEAVQMRFYPLDDVEVLFSIGNADVRFNTVQATARADITSMQVDPDLANTEVVVLTNSVPFLNIFNPTGYALGQSRVVFLSVRYALDAKSLEQFNTGAEARKGIREKYNSQITLASAGGF